QVKGKEVGGDSKENVDEGKNIFENGVATANIPPCASCHGPQAKGNGPFPRLAGQLYDYITNKLTNWDKERGQNPSRPDTSAVMQPIAHSLTQPQIKAVAPFLNYLEESTASGRTENKRATADGQVETERRCGTRYFGRGNSNICFSRRGRRTKSNQPFGRCTGENQLLQRLSRSIGARLQRLLPYTPPRRAAAGIPAKSAACFH